MAIKFKCPHCQKPLSVKDHLAGKRAACPNPACKKVLTIPQPDPAPAAADMEALAAAALADEPPAPQPEQEVKTITFNCPQCDAEVTLPLDLAGKRSPCPECRRIIKVPEPVKKEPKDWRKVATGGPSLARDNAEAALEGAWGTATSAATVSRQALTEAGLGAPRQKTPLRTWILRGAIAAGVLLAAGIGTLVAFHLLSASKQDKAITEALRLAGDESKHTPQQRAAIQLAAGEFYLHSGRDDAAAKARDHMQAARSLLVQASGEERDALLIRLALVQIDLGGEGADLDKGQRIKWEEPPKKGKQAARQESDSVRAELRRTLENLRSPEARAEGMRLVARKLIDKNQTGLLVALASQLNFRDRGGQSEADASMEVMAIAGLELARAKQKDPAQKLLERAFHPYNAAEDAGKAGKRPALSASLVALCHVLSKPEPPARKEGDTVNPDDRDAQIIGQADALARQDKLTEARQAAAGARNAGARFRALVAIADRNPPDQADIKSALDLAEGELKGKASPWQLWRLARIAAAAGLTEPAQQAAAAIPSPGLRGAAQFEVVQAKLATDKAKAGDTLAASVESKSGSAALAWIALARHNAHRDAGTLKTVQGWDETTRPYGLAGAALGMQD